MRQSAEIQGAPDGQRTLTCDSDAIILDLDVVTALGIVVAEVVAQQHDHAVPRRQGRFNFWVGCAPPTTTSQPCASATTGTGFRPKAESKRMDSGGRRMSNSVRGKARPSTLTKVRLDIQIPVEHTAPPSECGRKPRGRREVNEARPGTIASTVFFAISRSSRGQEMSVGQRSQSMRFRTSEYVVRLVSKIHVIKAA